MTDDIDGSETEETVRFGLHGSDCEIELSEKHADPVAETIGAYIRIVRLARRLRGARQRIPTDVAAKYESAH